MRVILAFLLLVSALASPGGAALGDQTDPELAPLFEALKNARDSESSLPIEKQIWEVWTRNDDPDINRLMQVGMTLLGSGALGQALQVFSRITVDDPDFSEGWNKRAAVLYLMGNFESSIRDIRRTLALEPRHFGALSGLGLIYRSIDKPESALRVFKKTLEIHPQSESARFHIEELRAELGGPRL